MTAFELYRVYLALKLHFTTEKFDIQQVPRLPAKLETFQQKKGVRFALQRIIRKHTPVQCVEFLVANFVAGDKYGGVFQDKGEHIYQEWQRRNHALAYVYEQDLLILRNLVAGKTIEALWSCHEGHPVLLKSYFGKTCSLETLVILDKLFTFREGVTTTLTGDPVWKEVELLIRKYRIFVPIDIPTFQTITHKLFEMSSIS